MAFTTNGTGIEDGIEPTFGRCLNFLIVDTDSGDAHVVPNPGASSAGAAGVKAAETLVTGSIGVNARPLLEAAGISIVTGKSGKIRAHLIASGPPPEDAQPLPASAKPRSAKPPDAAMSRKPAGYCIGVRFRAVGVGEKNSE